MPAAEMKASGYKNSAVLPEQAVGGGMMQSHFFGAWPFNGKKSF
jgi:hypothetical protein